MRLIEVPSLAMARSAYVHDVIDLAEFGQLVDAALAGTATEIPDVMRRLYYSQPVTLDPTILPTQDSVHPCA